MPMVISLPLEPAPVRFGTDGWRGLLGVDFTLERLLSVAAAAAAELAASAPAELPSREVVVGYDRRFMADALASSVCAAVRGVGLEPVLASTAAPTPAFSFAAVQRGALGALVITASHNPPEWLGLKIKGPFGGSVADGFTARVERRLTIAAVQPPQPGETPGFDPWPDYLADLRAKVDCQALARGLRAMPLKVIVDSMHGAAAGAMAALLGDAVEEIRSRRDPLFGGHPPEPLGCHLPGLIERVRSSGTAQRPALGIGFDGDGDRIAAVDECGSHCSTQLLLPLLIDHMAGRRGLPGAVVKSVSGSDLVTAVARQHQRLVLEKAVGFKHIAAEMLAQPVVVGGEESGGLGFGIHLPERDGLLSALLTLEALVARRQPLAVASAALRDGVGLHSHYDRLDLRLPDMAARHRFEQVLAQDLPQQLAGLAVGDVIRTDGVKLRLGGTRGCWLMCRFSGTEPLLRLYCEAADEASVERLLTAAAAWVHSN